jgi:cobalt-zinc-cadmium efflux system outer membrane protein
MKTKPNWIVLAALAAGTAGCVSPQPMDDSRGVSTSPVAAAHTSSAGATFANLPPLGADAGLRDYLAYAALNNAGLEAAYDRWQAVMEKIPQARALPDPRLSYGHFIRSVETRVGPQQHRVGVAQSFPWLGKRGLRGDVATQEAHASYQEYEAAKLRLFYNVKSTWFELAYLHRAIEITENNLSLLKDLEKVAQTKVRGGSGLAGVAKAQVELGKLEDQKRSLLDFRQPLAARLNAALSRPANSPIAFPKSIAVSSRQLDEQRLLEWLAETNPELRGLEAQIAREQKGVELAGKDYFPDVTVGVDYTQTDGALVPGVRDNGNDPVMATVSINIPLWRKKYDAALRAAEHRRSANKNRLQNRANLLRADLKMALYKFQDAERKIDLYRDTLTPLAEQSLEIAQQSWESGKADFLNLIDAERLLLEFQLQIERARANREQRLAEIEMLVGRELPDPANDASPPGALSQPHPAP